MRSAEWSALARSDFEVHFLWLSQFGRAMADRTGEAILTKADWLSNNVHAGSPLGISDLRKSIVKQTRYIVIYRPFHGGIEVVRVRHAAEDWRLH